MCSVTKQKFRYSLRDENKVHNKVAILTINKQTNKARAVMMQPSLSGPPILQQKCM
jgi:hypothetical protein